MTNPLIDLKNLSEPLTKLVEVISAGIGTIHAPFGTVRQSKADAQAKIIQAKADSEVLNIKARAYNRLIYKEESRQENIEKISTLAASELPKKVSDEPVDDDWAVQFFDHAQDVHDEDMQKLWSRILAGEVSTPGTYSKRVLQFIKTLEKWEAEKFSELCSFATKDKNGWYMIFDEALETKILEKLGNKSWVNHFSSIGLIETETKVATPSKIKGLEVNYFDETYILEGPLKENKPTQNNGIPFITPIEIPISIRSFTTLGQQLVDVAGAKPINNMMTILEKALNTQAKITTISLSKLEET